MPNISRRQLAVLRLLHGGAILRVDDRGRGVLLVTEPVMNAPLLTGLVQAGWIAPQTMAHYTITEAGRDQVRVHDDIDQFTEST